eukprot:jgi/Ulvmu1/3469/UM016_0089.1
MLHKVLEHRGTIHGNAQKTFTMAERRTQTETQQLLYHVRNGSGGQVAWGHLLDAANMPPAQCSAERASCQAGRQQGHKSQWRGCSSREWVVFAARVPALRTLTASIARNAGMA